MNNDMTKQMLAVFAVGLLVAVAPAADTWRWLGNYTCAKVGPGSYGYARNFETNWINMSTGQYGIPANGDFIVVTSTAGTFGIDFTSANVFGGLTYEATSGSGGDQCNFDYLADYYSFETEYNSSEGRCDFLAIPKPGVAKPAQLVEFKYFTNAAAEKGNVLGRDTPDAETVVQALAYRTALARRPDWNHPIAATVVEVCGSAGYNWFDL